MKPLKCSMCKNKGVMGFKGFYVKGEVKYYCPTHVTYAPVDKGTRGIYDELGKPRDREWLNNKLELTRNEKTWHKDIKDRKVLPDGTVARIDEKGRRYK